MDTVFLGDFVAFGGSTIDCCEDEVFVWFRVVFEGEFVVVIFHLHAEPAVGAEEIDDVMPGFAVGVWFGE